MALSRRSGNRFQGSIWPGYVDAVTGLLMVLTFVLTIFMVVQFVLRETISGQESQLDQLGSEIAALSQALGLERDRSARLQSDLGRTTTSLEAAEDELDAQSTLIASLTQQRADQDAALDRARAQITSFEAQVASLLSQRDEARGTVEALTAERDTLVSDKEALQLALAQAREEIDAGTEEARMLAARRDALQALIADLERQAADDADARGALVARVDELESALSEEEQTRIAESAAAAALRERLKSAETELTAMTLALEEQRRRAEETLTLLAAAENTGDDLDMRLAAALLKLDETQAALSQSGVDLAQTRDRLAEAEEGRQVTFGQLSKLEAELAAALGDVQDRDAKLAELSARLGVLERALATAETERDEVRGRLGTETAALTAERDAQATARQDAEDAAARAAEETAQVRRDLTAQLDAARAQAAQDQAALQGELDRLRTDLGERVTALDEVELRIVALEAALARAESEKDGLQTRLQDALQSEDMAAALRQDKASLEGALAGAQAQVQEGATRIGTLEQRIATLEALIERTTGERDADRARSEEEIASLRERLAQAVAAQKAAETQIVDRETLQRQLAAALAEKLKAQQDLQATLTEAEQRAILLRQANQELEERAAASSESARRTTLLNQQVAQMRTQLASLQALLDDYKDRDATNQVQLQSLGADLNAALAQKAAEERRRRQLEEAERKRLERYKSEFFGALRDVFAGQDGVRIVGDRFVFSSEVLFAPGKADLSTSGQRQIASVVETLRQIADQIPDNIDWVLQVDGHTDDVPLSGGGEFRDNWQLSQARALSVVRYMTDFLGFPPDRLSANGFAQYQPIAEGTSSAARAANRRIELKFTER